MSVVIYLFFIFLSVIGFCDILHSLSLKLLSPRKRGKRIMLCYLPETTPDLELRFLIEQRDWYGKSYADKIVAVLDSSDANTTERCLKAAEKNDVSLIGSDELINYILTEF